MAKLPATFTINPSPNAPISTTSTTITSITTTSNNSNWVSYTIPIQTNRLSFAQLWQEYVIENSALVPDNQKKYIKPIWSTAYTDFTLYTTSVYIK